MTADTPWRMDADGDWSRHYRGHRLSVEEDAGVWSWWASEENGCLRAAGGQPSERRAMDAADRWVEQADAARLLADAEVTP